MTNDHPLDNTGDPLGNPQEGSIDPFEMLEKASEPLHRSKHRKQGRPASKRLNARRGRKIREKSARKRQR